ncbi:MAG: hypothetical protein ACRDNZ_14440 [Streptosporangiaceae bacterium]
MGSGHLGRLGRARDLLSASFDTSACVLACYSAMGFEDDLRARHDRGTVLIALGDIYR